MRFRLPIPSSWADFELLCQQLWKELWCDPNTQRNGRQGQPQAGVDVFGVPIYSGFYSGVQCKDKDTRLGSILSPDDLLSECRKATAFSPPIATFSMATTAPRDASLQQMARELNAAEEWPFKIHIWSWDDLEAEILCRPSLLTAFYNGKFDTYASNSVAVAVSAPKDQLLGFFARPHLATLLGPQIREHVTQVVYELADNAFAHGGATHVRLTFDGSHLLVVDDGQPFNPLECLASGEASAESHIGSWVFDLFRKTYRHGINIQYRRAKNGKREINALSIAFSNAEAWRNVPESLDIPVDLSVAFSRGGARRFAESLPIPIGIKELVLNFTIVGNPSVCAAFISGIRDRLPKEVHLVISHARNSSIGGLQEFFPVESVEFRAR